MYTKDRLKQAVVDMMFHSTLYSDMLGIVYRATQKGGVITVYTLGLSSYTVSLLNYLQLERPIIATPDANIFHTGPEVKPDSFDFSEHEIKRFLSEYDPYEPLSFDKAVQIIKDQRPTSILDIVTAKCLPEGKAIVKARDGCQYLVTGYDPKGTGNLADCTVLECLG